MVHIAGFFYPYSCAENAAAVSLVNFRLHYSLSFQMNGTVLWIAIDKKGKPYAQERGKKVI